MNSPELQEQMREFYDKVMGAFVETYSTLEAVAEYLEGDHPITPQVDDVCAKYREYYLALTAE